jgi:hypothetical protein
MHNAPKQKINYNYMKFLSRPILLILFTLFSLQITSQVCFNPFINYAAGSVPEAVCSADFNSDGKVDLMVANTGGNNISLLLGTGTGSFSVPTNFTVGINPISIITADFNGDTKVDIAVANANSDNISILLGNGLGNFTTSSTPSTGASTSPRCITVGDFNTDGKLDLAVSLYAQWSVGVLLGNGNGTFGSINNFSTIGFPPEGVTTVDLNSDGKLDLISANDCPNGSVSIFIGNGLGNFASATTFTIGGAISSRAVKSADLNGDSKNDLVVANFVSNNVSVFLGNGAGSFTTATNFNAGSCPRSIAIADYNNDSKLDIATVNYCTDSTSILLGDGTGALAAPIDFQVCSGSPFSLISQDVNNDSKPDLVIASQSGGTSVLLNCFLPVGLQTINFSEVTTIYPNPANNALNIASKNIGREKVRLYNTAGQLVLENDYEKNSSIDISFLIPGLYTLSLSDKITVIYKKLIIAR